LTRPSSRWLAFIAATILVAIILVAVPPPTSTLLFVIVVAGMAALAGINAARQAGLSARDVLALLADRSRAGWWAWDAARRAVQTPPLAHTLERPIAPIQLAAELIGIALLVAAVTQPYLAPNSTEQLPGLEAEWLTSSVHLAALTLDEYGYLPLWQPYLEMGEPLIDNPFSFILNPISTSPGLIWGGVRGIKISVALHALLAGWGGWALGRVLGFAWVGRLLLAALLVGKGNMHAMIGAGYFQLGVSQAYMPWIIAGTIAILRVKTRRWPVALTAQAFTLLFWAGNIWYTLPMLISMALLTLTHVVRRRESTGPRSGGWSSRRC
jgi:hypothetical protein